MNIGQWDGFREFCKSGVDTFFLGNYRNQSTAQGPFNQYGKMILKNCRFYTRPLNSDEIKLNYDTRLAYDEATD